MFGTGGLVGAGDGRMIGCTLTVADRIRLRQRARTVWLPGFLVDPFRRCSHDCQRAIYGDEIIAAGFRRSRCLDCGRLLQDLPRKGQVCRHGDALR